LVHGAHSKKQQQQQQKINWNCFLIKYSLFPGETFKCNTFESVQNILTIFMYFCFVIAHNLCPTCCPTTCFGTFLSDHFPPPLLGAGRATMKPILGMSVMQPLKEVQFLMAGV